MKVAFIVACLFALFAVVFTLSSEEESKIIDTCKKQTKATNEDLKVIEDPEMIPKSKTQFCLIACYYKATGVMDSNNKVVFEPAMKELEPIKKESKELYEKFEKLVKQCISEITPSKDECDSVKLYTDCVVKKSKEMGIDK